MSSLAAPANDAHDFLAVSWRLIQRRGHRFGDFFLDESIHSVLAKVQLIIVVSAFSALLNFSSGLSPVSRKKGKL